MTKDDDALTLGTLDMRAGEVRYIYHVPTHEDLVPVNPFSLYECTQVGL